LNSRRDCLLGIAAGDGDTRPGDDADGDCTCTCADQEVASGG
jgi:hypothetical protein